MDSAQNTLLGYSASGLTNLTDNHSIRYTGRNKGDALNTMTVPEAIIFTGTRNVNRHHSLGRLHQHVGRSGGRLHFLVQQPVLPRRQHQRHSGAPRLRPAASPKAQARASAKAAPAPAVRPARPTIGGAAPIANNQIQVTWTGISPTPGSYAIERAIGNPGSEGYYAPVGFVSGAATSFTDTTVQGGVIYTYRVIAATDTKGRCQAFVRSGNATATATGACSLKPTFARSELGRKCEHRLVRRDHQLDHGAPQIARSVRPSNTTSTAATRRTLFLRQPAASRPACPGPSSYTDSNGVVSGNTYYYVVRAEDNSTGNGGPCGGGNEETNSIVVAGTPYGSGTQVSPGTWTDAGGDGTAFLRLNPGSADQIWRFVKTSDDAGANHTPGGSYAYRNAGPGPNTSYSPSACASAETPDLIVGATSVNLTYWERHQTEVGWDGVAIEYSRNGGPWTIMNAPSNLPADGCQSTDVISDYRALSCTGAPPANACGDAATVPTINGPAASGTSCANWVQRSADRLRTSLPHPHWPHERRHGQVPLALHLGWRRGIRRLLSG